ncbi:MAG: hypothetical protein NT169_11575 [Chloroflexi bacterium]|nr:hypothetical protein [Chloroflexota bacterium]
MPPITGNTLTIADLLAGAEPKLPPTATTFKTAGKVKTEGAKQEGLFGG